MCLKGILIERLTSSAFESASLSFLYLNYGYWFKLVISNTTSHMLSIILLYVLIYFHNYFTMYSNVLLSIFKTLCTSLQDIVNTYIIYKKNIFSLCISYIFPFTAINNLVGLIPFSNTINNHLNITLMLSFICWLGISFIGFKCFSTYFLSMFCVLGIPRVLIPFLACIEILSYLFRFISLSLRLFANIVAGHISLETIYIFLYNLTFGINNTKIVSIVAVILPSVFSTLLIIFEIVISFLQGYIFIVLCLIYLKDSLYLH